MRYAVALTIAAMVAGTALLTPVRAQAPAAQSPSTSGAPNAQGTAVVIANGLGTTVESAVQNAAENALTQVVGSFVDTEKLVERRSQIAEGIRTDSRNVSNKMHEYSQGAIKSFDVLDTQQDGGIVRVTAKVAVQMDNFRAQMNQALGGSTTVSKGLFAQAATEHNQQVGADAIFIERIVTPIVQGTGLTMTVGPPARMDMTRLLCRRTGETSEKPACSQAFLNWDNAFRGQDSDLYRIPVTLSVDKGLQDAIWKAASSISLGPCTRVDAKQPFGRSSNIPVFSHNRQQANDYSPRDRSPHRYVVVSRQMGESSFGEVCYQILSNPKDYDAAVDDLGRVTFLITVFDQQGSVIDEYQYRPYITQRDPSRPEGQAASLDFFPSYVSIQSGFGEFDQFRVPRNQTFNLLIHVPLPVIENAARMDVKVVNE